MSVMAETSQLAIGPHVAMAAVRLALYAWIAVCREALVVKPGRETPTGSRNQVVKVHCCGDEGGGGDGGARAQTSHPARVTLPSEDHVKALPSNTLLGPTVPLYVAPFTISLSKPLSVLKAVALKS